MHDSLRSRLKAYEQSPPPDAWKNISLQLDEQFVSADASVSRKLENFAVSPPAIVWENIQKEIQPAIEPQAGKRASVIPIFSRRLAVAVIFLAVVALASLYFFTGNNEEQLAAIVPDKPTLERQQPVRADTVKSEKIDNNLAENDQLAGVQSKKIALAPLPSTRKRTPATRRIAGENSPAYIASYANTINEAHLSTPELVSEQQVISVSAPPIRDRYGNIIMDLAVIRKPGQQYITVTSPNGNQTRISNKFLDCLRYINGNISSAEMDGDALECRTRFENWRNKLLSDGSFIPTADNFFDIFEMKDMIQE